MPAEGSSASAPWSVWRIPGITALVGHVLLVPFYFAARAWDIARRPLGFDHWPSEPGWPAGSGSSEFDPGQLPLIVAWLLLWLIIFGAFVAAGAVALGRRW